MKRQFRWFLAGAGLVALLASSATLAQAQQVSAASCAGAAMLGGTQLMCSHTDPTAPAEFCTFSWTLQTTAGAPKIVEGSFMVPPGANNLIVYQSGGFSAALANPIILCQGRAERDAK